MAKADRAFSRYIRQKHADAGGWVSCVTCGQRMPWEDSDCGHWIKRGHHATRFDERNCGTQCTACNRYRGGAMDEFAEYIVKTYGVETMHELLALKRTNKTWRISELRELIDFYQGVEPCETQSLSEP